MKTLLAVAVLLPSIAFAADFRESNWGDSSAQVMAAERGKLAEKSASSLTYRDSIFGRPIAVIYQFEEDHLVGGTYYNLSRYKEPRKFQYDYKKAREFLSNRHGKPLDGVLVQAVATEHPGAANGIQSHWTTSRTEIVMTLDTASYPAHQAVFKSRAQNITATLTP